MSEEPIYLTTEQVAVLQRMALERHGGQDGMRDKSAVESAVMQPRNVWYYAKGDLFDIAAAYAFHLAESQAFLDGNKRTGLAAALVFLEINRVTVPEATIELYSAMIAIAERRMKKTELAGLLRSLAGRSR